MKFVLLNTATCSHINIHVSLAIFCSCFWDTNCKHGACLNARLFIFLSLFIYISNNFFAIRSIVLLLGSSLFPQIMDDHIEWEEAKSSKLRFDLEDDDKDSFEAKLPSPANSISEDLSQETSDNNSDLEEYQEVRKDSNKSSNVTKKRFSHKNLNLSLKRNIVSLADSNQHQPRPTYQFDNQIESFDAWLETSLVAISPTADVIFFANRNQQDTAFIAKLRMEPINQYTTRSLQIPIDYDEQITSLLCLPIMSGQKTAIGLVDWTALVIGFSSGYIKFYTEQSICLLSLKFCDEPVMGLKCQTQKNNSNARSESHFATIVDEILIIHRTNAIVVDGLGLYENLRIAKAEMVKNGSDYEPAYNLTNLPSILNCQRWNIESIKGSTVVDAEILGTRKTTTFDSLMSDSYSSDRVPPKVFAKTLALVGRNPFVSCHREPKDSPSHSYTELIGSIFSLWNKPQPSRTQITEITKPASINFFDKERYATSIVSSPDKRLAAITDDFGRVLLVDVTNWLVIRIWKGYRSAQCGWTEVKKNPDKRGSPYASFLVIYAPKRGLLEIWSVQRGPRVAAFNVGKNCRLLYSGYKMLNMRAESKQKSSTNANPTSQLIEQSYSTHCYLLNAKSENLFLIDLPYTYSLYKYGDLKSRDNLLVSELIAAIRQDSEIEVISEVLHRIALAESLQSSIQKIACNLLPNKIVPIMENLINKTMKNYDNHSGETMTDDDSSIIELCKRLIRLCIVFNELSESQVPHDIRLPDVNQRLIEHYEEHPQEIDEFSKQLGWPIPEILRYLSLISLERSYRQDHATNPWPGLGEPLTWVDFVSCFDLSRVKDNRRSSKERQPSISSTKLSIRLKEFTNKFLGEDRVIKTAIFMYNSLSENHYKLSQSFIKQSCETKLAGNYNYLEPSSRLALLFQFWLSTNLSNHWKMWAFLQDQVGQISDELKVISMERNDDKILIETWKQIYNLILGSDNIYSAITATATIRSDTIRMIQDNERREKLEKDEERSTSQTDSEKQSNTMDWECLCIDAERMSLLSQQLEDVFLLNLLLKYSVDRGHLVENYIYSIPRISVANVLRNGPTIVSELIAQWAVQSGVNLSIFVEPYGSCDTNSGAQNIQVSASITGRGERFGTIMKKKDHLDKEEHAKELLHHAKTSFPCSLEPDTVLLHCIWEFCRQWSTNLKSTDKTKLLKRVFDCIALLSTVQLRHRSSSLAYKTFFQRTFERLITLVETNNTILSVKSLLLRDALTRKELNMGEDCLQDFVQFCCDLSELMLQTLVESNNLQGTEIDRDLKLKLLSQDSWWSTPSVVRMLGGHSRKLSSTNSDLDQLASRSLVSTVIYNSSFLDANTLIELNKLANLMNLIFKLKIVRAYPMSLIGEESRQILKIELQQTTPTYSSTIKDEVKSRSTAGLLSELRQKFARKCIINIAGKLSEETNEFNEEDGIVDENYDKEYNEDDDTEPHSKSILTRRGSASKSKKKHPDQQRTTSSAFIVDKRPKVRDYNLKETSNSGLLLDDVDEMSMRVENNEAMVLFTNLLSLANEWRLNCDELYLEFVFELYRCNHDKIASQISNRIQDQQTLANGLLKISSQRILVLFGLSPHVSGSNWRRRSDKWSIFQPNVASWLKRIQQEEMKREIACLSFSESVKLTTLDNNKTSSSNSDDAYSKKESTFGLQTFALRALQRRTKLLLESATNHLDGQASRLAYDLLQLLESRQDYFLEEESEPSAE